MTTHPAEQNSLWYAESGERLSFMLMFAIMLHAVLILAMNFTLPENKNESHTMEITLARFDDIEAPDQADYIAQANQQGSGEAVDKHEPSTRERAIFESESVQPQSAQAAQALNQSTLAQPPEPSANQQLPEDLTPVSEQQSGLEAVLTTSAERSEKRSEQDELKSKQAPATQTGTSTSMLSRSLEIASLQARLRQEQEQMARRPKVTRVTSASTLADKDALYHENWRRRIEMIGNLNYPEEARARNINGSLQLLVSVKPDGSIQEVSILKSSGHAILDDAAIRIVQMAAPYQPFPQEMRERTDLLEIIRTWKFEKEARIY